MDLSEVAKKCRFFIGLALACAPMLIWASMTINAAAVNGTSSTTVTSGATISALLKVTLTGNGDKWGSIAWSIGGSPATCDSSPAFSGAGTYSQSFNISAPTTSGTYDVVFTAYKNSNCTGNTNDTLTLTGAVIVASTPSTSCSPPANTPAGLVLSCQCDSFGRTSLNPSPMFSGSNWVVSTSDSTGIVPYINGATGFLRLTENTGNNAKAATVPGFFPAAGNYISVEFKHYAYNGSGADGIALALSDYTVPPVPGAYGGSLGYAQKSGTNGFAGGWIGVGVDEYGNFSNPTEGRVLGRGFIVDGIAVRGSGSGQSGYPYLGGTSGSLSPGIDNAGSTSPAYGHFYQIIVDARNSAAGQTWVAVNRDTSGTGNSYSPVVSSFDAFAASTAAGYAQAAVPANWQLSFTGSTGGSTNIHELGQVRICAQYFVPPDGGTAGGFSAIDDALSSDVQSFLTGHIYTKLAGTAFKLKVAALSNSQIQMTYAAGSNKNVTVKLVDNTDGACGADADRASACASSACNGKAAVSGGSQTLAFTSADKGVKTTGDFTLASAYANLIAVVGDGTTTACSVDSFSVRPTAITGVTTDKAGNAGLTGAPKLKAGTDSFGLTAVINAPGYTGKPKINATAMAANDTDWAVGTLSPAGGASPNVFPAAAAGKVASTSEATGSFTYSEVGNFRFLGYDPATDTGSPRGIYDDDWVSVDSAATKGDCIAGSYANAKDGSGKYGCLFGLQAQTSMFGRFVPDHFTYVGGGLGQFCASGAPFTYMGQPALGVAYNLQAMNGGGTVTSNYSAVLKTPYPVASPALVAEDQATANQGCDLASRIGGLESAQWVAGVYALNVDAAKLANTGVYAPAKSAAVFSRPSAPAALNAASCAATRANAGGPFRLLDIGVAMNDTDAGATLSGADIDAGSSGACSGTGCTAKRIGSTGVVYGRLWLNNAYGSEMLPLAVPAQAQFWSAAGWQKNPDDGCTALTQPTRQDTGNGGLNFYPAVTGRNALAAGDVVAQMGGSTANSVNLQTGDARLVLRNPNNAAQGPGTGKSGYVDIVGGKFGTGSWLPSTGSVRACFGACGPRAPVIYLRESY